MKFLQLICLAGALASAVNAAVTVYDNTGEASAGVDDVDFVGPLYDSFTPGAAGQITSLQLVLTLDGTSLGTVDAGLYADNATTPGQLIAVLGGIADSALSNTPIVDNIALTVYPSLTGGTLYWIGLFGTTNAGWSYDYDGNGIGVLNQFFANQTGIYSDDDDPYQMSITEGVTVTPEPSGGFLMVTGAGILTLLRRKGQRRTAALIN